MNDSNLERVQRIHKAFKHKEKDNHYTIKRLYAEMLRATAKDFPQFRTAATPNQWEQGYHQVLDTLHDIAYEFEQLDQHKPYDSIDT